MSYVVGRSAAWRRSKGVFLGILNRMWEMTAGIAAYLGGGSKYFDLVRRIMYGLQHQLGAASSPNDRDDRQFDVMVNERLKLLKQLEEQNDVEKQIALLSEMLNVLPFNHRLRLSLLHNLGVVLINKCRCIGNTEDLERSIQTFEEVLDPCASGHPICDVPCVNLGCARNNQNRYNQTGVGRNLERLIQPLTELTERQKPSHPFLSPFLNDLAGALRDRYCQTGTEADLDGAIQLYSKALNNCPATHPVYYPVILSNLARSFLMRYERTGEEAEIDAAIRFYAKSLALLSPDHPDRAESTLALAISLNKRYALSQVEEDNERSILMLTELLELQSPSHPLYSSSLPILGNALLERYDRTNAAEDVERAIQLHSEALKIHPAGHLDYPTKLCNLAASFLTRYGLSGKERDINESIRLFTESLELLSPSHPDCASFTLALANTLRIRYRQSGVIEDLNRCIQLLTESLEIQSSSHRPIYGSFVTQLGDALLERYRQTGEEDNLERVNRLHSEVLKTCPAHSRHPGTLQNLAKFFVVRYEQKGNEEDINESIRLYTESLELLSSADPNCATSADGLARSFGARYRRSGGMDDLQRCIHLLTELLETHSSSHPLHTSSMQNLGHVLIERYRRTGDEIDLERAIELNSEVLKTCPASHPFSARTLNDLARSFAFRYERTGEEEDINESIRLGTESLELLSSGNPDHVAFSFVLAISLRKRYTHSGVEEDFEKATQLLAGLTELQPTSHPLYSSSLSNLGSALMDRYHQRGGEDNLERAIQFYSEAVKDCATGNPDYPTRLRNLGISILARCEQTSEQGDLEQSIYLLRHARDLCPRGHPLHMRSTSALAGALWMARANTTYIMPPSSPDEVFELLKEVSVDFISPLEDSLTCTVQWVAYAFQSSCFTQIAHACEHSIQFLSRFLSIGPTMKLQYKALAKHTQILTLPMDAASFFVQLGNIERAIELLDEGRSLLWTEGQRFRKPLHNTDLLDSDLAERFESTRTKLQLISTVDVKFTSFLSTDTPVDLSYNDLLPQKRKLLQDYDEILQAIRQVIGFEDFLQSSPFTKLKVAATEGPVIVINCSEIGSYIIIVYADRLPAVIGLEKNFHAKASEYHQAYLEIQGTTLKLQGKAFRNRLRPILEWLWEAVVSKVVETLGRADVPKGSRIWWCPTSFLTVLPIHAAGYETKNTKEYLIDSYISSYTPTLQALIDARQFPPQSIPGHPVKLLVVGQTDLTLKHAEAEVKAIHRLGSFVKCLVEKDATEEQVLRELPSHQWVHFVCHGTLAPLPFDSSLRLFGEDKLTIGNIIKMNHSNASFAFLAACHSAEQTPAGLSDEVLHLAGAMLFSGFRSVVGTMWEM
ncbi:hypothetical protein L218DRAFT_1054973, partial [Marasmius fiardii PR-910]